MLFLLDYVSQYVNTFAAFFPSLSCDLEDLPVILKLKPVCDRKKNFVDLSNNQIKETFPLL